MLYNQDWGRANPVRDVLLKAADLLETYGHVKHTRVDHRGSMCILGAIDAAQNENKGRPRLTSPDTPLTYQVSDVVAATLGLHVGLHEGVGADSRHAIVAWNNSNERTAQEVIDVLRLAARTKVEA